MTTYPCPVCLTEANLEEGCPGCGRAPDPLAAEVIGLDARIAELQPRIAAARENAEQAQRAYAALSEELQGIQRRRGQLAAQVWAAAHGPGRAAAEQPAAAAAVRPTGRARPETSTQTVKNVLFVLGGILLSIAAIVFTAFAWGTFGMAGKAVILGVFTAATLAVPLLALRRNLRGTAETFAALGLLLVALDGYAIWRVDLGGVQGALPGWTYAGLVAGITAAVAMGYGRVTKLAAPAIIGLVTAQPVLPLVFEPLIDGRAAGFSLAFSAVAAANLPVVRSRFSVLQLIAALGYALSLVLSHGYAFAALYQSDADGSLAAAAGVTLLAGALALAGPLLRPQPIWLTAAVAWCVVLIVLIGLVASRRLAPDHDSQWTVGLIAALALATALIERSGRGAVWRGAAIGVAFSGAIASLFVGALAVAGGISSLSGGGDFLDRLPNVTVEVLLLTAAAIVLVRRTRPAVAGSAAVIGTVLTALAIPVGYANAGLPAIADLVATAGLLAALLWLRPPDAVRVVIGVGVAGLSGHAVLAGLDRPAESAYTLGGLSVLAAGTAVAGWWRDRVAGLVAVIVSGPLLAGLGAAVAATAGWNAVHGLALTAAVLPIGAWALRAVPAYARAADVSARATVLVAVAIAVLSPGADPWPKTLYVAGGALALAVLYRSPVTERLAGWAVLLVLLIAAQPPLAALVEPYGWMLRGWGTVPAMTTVVTLGDVTAFVLLVAASLLTFWDQRSRLWTAATVPVILAMVHFGLPWPSVPLVLLGCGLALIAVTGLRSRMRAIDAAVVAYAAVLTGSGLSGLAVMPWSTILGLSVTCAVFVAVGLFARPDMVRVAAWLAAAVAWLGLAVCSAHAAHLTGRGVAFTVLFAAAVLLFASVTPLSRAPRAVEIPAQLAAVAVLATASSAARLSEACLVWGVALGLSVFPRLSAPWRGEWLLRLCAAGVLEVAALWALLIARHVHSVEAYSLPVAGIALVVGFLAMRRDPALTSWIGYGPALVAAFGPTLAVILTDSGEPVRRLALGVAALVTVVAGAVRRRQAPVVIGGAVLIIVALHELTQVWSRLPLWLPIGVGGAILLAIAITYERRLRDLRRLRSTLASYT